MRLKQHPLPADIIGCIQQVTMHGSPMSGERDVIDEHLGNTSERMY